MLCEMFATLGLEGEGTSEEQPIRLNNVTPEDFEALVHYYSDFQLVTPSQSLSFDELTRWIEHRELLLELPRFNTGKG